MTRKMKFKVIAMAILLITGFAKDGIAFPVPATDFSQIGESVKVTMNQVQEIKTQVESNINMVKEGINGGFGMAVGDLFGNLGLDGTFDRFGNALNDAKSSIQGAVGQVQGGISQFNLDKENRISNLAKETAREMASSLKNQREAFQEAKNIGKAARQAADVRNTYNFLKDNHSINSVVNQVKNQVNTDVSSKISDIKGTVDQQKNSLISGVSKGVETIRNSVNQGSDEDSLGTNEGGSSTEEETADDSAEAGPVSNNNWRGLIGLSNKAISASLPKNTINKVQNIKGAVADIKTKATESRTAKESK